MARTNIELDDRLVEKAMRLTGARTKREVVDIALRRLVEKGSAERQLHCSVDDNYTCASDPTRPTFVRYRLETKGDAIDCERRTRK